MANKKFNQFTEEFTPSTGDYFVGYRANGSTEIRVLYSTISGDLANAGGGSVTSVFSRTGVVTAQSGDYGTSGITNQSLVAGNSLTDALNTLYASTGLGGNVTSVFGRTGVVVATADDYGSNEITNDSVVAGSNVTQALNALNSGVGSVSDYDSATAPTKLIGTGDGYALGSEILNVGGNKRQLWECVSGDDFNSKALWINKDFFWDKQVLGANDVLGNEVQPPHYYIGHMPDNFWPHSISVSTPTGVNATMSFKVNVSQFLGTSGTTLASSNILVGGAFRNIQRSSFNSSALTDGIIKQGRILKFYLMDTGIFCSGLSVSINGFATNDRG